MKIIPTLGVLLLCGQFLCAQSLHPAVIDTAVPQRARLPHYDSLQEVTITSLGVVTNLRRSPIPVSLVTHEMILQATANTAIDLIASQPGVSETTEGVGTTKPQINGLGFNRVLVLVDGLPQEDFQWGDDHGILIDPYAIYDAEVIRGPASLQYGASAEAGVINFKTTPFATKGTWQGSWLSEYHSNNGYMGHSLHLGGNHDGFVYDLKASGELAHSYWNPKDGYVWGSAWNQGNGRLTIGFNQSWGYSRLTISALYRRIQVPDGNRDSVSEKFVFDHPVGEKTAPTLRNFLSYDATIASDKLLGEYQAWWQNKLNVHNGDICLDLGLTSSVHHDIDSGNAGANNMAVYDVPYSLKFQRNNESGSIRLTTGINGMLEYMHNLAAPPAPYGADYEIPDYHSAEGGAYGIVERRSGALTLLGGLRYDITKFAGDGKYGFTAFSHTYSGWSGSVGASLALPRGHYLKLNLSRSFRVPAINELTSNGLNIGSNAFQLGNINLKPEQGYQLDLMYGYGGRDIRLELGGFYNRIANFIFANRTDSIMQGYPVYEYVSSNTAVLTGVNVTFNIHPDAVKWLQWNNRFSYIYSCLPDATDSTGHVPWTPAPHLHSELRFNIGDKPGSVFSGTYFWICATHYWPQNHIYSALHTEIPSAAYTLTDAGIGTRFVRPTSGRTFCSVYVTCTNLTNIAYADHLNLAQYFYARNGETTTVTNQRQGVFNMGRDVSVKVIFPFGSGSKNPL